MSTVHMAVRAIRKLEPEDFHILQALEQQMKNYEFAPKDAIQNQAQIPFSELDYRLPLFMKKGLVQGWRGKYLGYRLTTAGHDLLAMNALVNANVITALGKPLGVGKESDVYEAIAPDETQVALKFHRIGRTSFKKTKLKRNYTVKYNYTPDWHHQSQISAKKEYDALKLLYKNGVCVPKPIMQNRHIVVMSMIEGAELFRNPELEDARATYNEILDNLKIAYQTVKMIHGDLSPYNIIVQPDQKVLIIDWPQNVSTKHPCAKELLERDLQNVLTYFERKYSFTDKLEDALTYVIED